MEDLLSHPLVLAEAAVVERLRRNPDIRLHPTLVHAPLIYDPIGKREMAAIFREYQSIAREADAPLLLCSPTWRCNKERITAAGAFEDLNEASLAFVRDCLKPDVKVLVGGLLGCKNDCYLPEEGLSTDEAEVFHSWQVTALVRGKADFLIAQTLPALPEALGIARAMAGTQLPYIISFVINRQGKMLDGTSLAEAIAYIDGETSRAPTGYMVNCAYPEFLCPEKQEPQVFERLIGYQGNAANLDQCELENSETLEQESVSEWGEAMLHLHRKFGVRVLGGCCGTDGDYLSYLVGKNPEP